MWYRFFVVGLVLSCLFAGTALADERRFTYSYEADSVLPKGAFEFEQWATLKAGKEDGKYYQWRLREEIETGLTDRLTTALYLNLKDTYSKDVTGINDKDGTEFSGLSNEWKYMLFSPHQYPIGVLLYGEIGYDGEELELEEKLILEHIFAERWILVMNLIFEEEWKWQKKKSEKEFVISPTFGLCYIINDHWSIGLEAVNHREYPDFGDEEHSAWFLGPNIHYGSEKWWATLAILPQVTDVLDEHEEVEARLITGIFF